MLALNHYDYTLHENPSNHVLCIAELWFRPCCNKRQNDANVNGGGLTLYVRVDFTVIKLMHSNTTGPEKPRIPIA